MEMIEDGSFNSVVKAAFEDDVKIDDGKVRSLERIAALAVEERKDSRLLWRRFWSVSLLAASLALVVMFRTIVSQNASPDVSVVGNTIDILCMLDGISCESLNATSDEELLLAWQEIPCAY